MPHKNMSIVNYKYRYKDTTLEKWYLSENSPIQSQGWKKKDFLLYGGEIGNRNIDRMVAALDFLELHDWLKSWQEFSEFSDVSKYNGMPIKNGVELILDSNYIDKLILITESENQVIVDTLDTPPFLADALQQLVDSKKYVQRIGEATIFSPKVKVWVWSRNLWENKHTSGLVNLSPFVDTLTFSSGEGSGSWNMTLAPVAAEFLEDLKTGVWNIRGNSFIKQNNRLGYISNSSINREDDLRATYYFNNILQKNDMIFIQFEPLKFTEEDSRLDESIIIGQNNLVKTMFDCIGFIDQVGYSMQSQGGDVVINVSGGDMMHLLQQDAFYFYPEQFLLSKSGGMFYNLVEDEKGLSRTTNQLSGFTNEYYRKLGTIIPFTINALSRTGLVDSDLFIPYKDSRTKFFGVVDDVWGFTPSEGAYQILKIVMDERIQQRHIVDKNLGIESGTILSFLQRMVTPPFVQMLMDTYQDQFYLTFRQAPWDKAGYMELAEACYDNFTIYNRDVISENLNFNTDEIYTWYRLIPKPAVAGAAADQTVWTFFKAVRFPEYTKWFGERPLELTSNYLNYHDLGTTDAEKKNDSKSVMDQAIKDLKLMVDCYSYMPFTRRGTLTIRGDRRYRKGLIIYYKPTDEYFYVNAVNQQFRSNIQGADRITTLTVTRGIVKQYAKHYFRIIKTPYDEDGSLRRDDYSQDWIKGIAGKWKVRPWIFSFFIQRGQFAKNPALDKLLERPDPVERLELLDIDIVDTKNWSKTLNFTPPPLPEIDEGPDISIRRGAGPSITGGITFPKD